MAGLCHLGIAEFPGAAFWSGAEKSGLAESSRLISCRLHHSILEEDRGRRASAFAQLRKARCLVPAGRW